LTSDSDGDGDGLVMMSVWEILDMEIDMGEWNGGSRLHLPCAPNSGTVIPLGLFEYQRDTEIDRDRKRERERRSMANHLSLIGQTSIRSNRECL
jgi:hypothetical protein